MMPVLFTVGDFTIRTYLLCTVLAIFTAVVLIRYYEIPNLKGLGKLPPEIINYNGEALLIAVICTVIGSRLAYVVVNWDLYSEVPLNILALWRGGFAFHGALILAVPALAWHARFRRIPLGKLLDLAIPYITLSYAIGRLGCFFNGCCYGHVTESPWGLVYPALADVPRHPTQLYSFGAVLIIAVILLTISRREFTGPAKAGGSVFGWFLILIGGYRFMVEFLRVSEEFAFYLTLAQLVSLIMILGGAGLLLIRNSKSGGTRNV